MILETAILCLAANVYHEARGESIVGQYAVAQVTMNRAETPENVCEVVAAPNQFSWTVGKVRFVKGKRGIWMARTPPDALAWYKATKIAAAVLNGFPVDFTHGAKYFHAVYVQPNWGSLQKTVQIGAHVFYKEKR